MRNRANAANAKPSSRGPKAASKAAGDRKGPVKRKRGDTLGLNAFERISAVEGVCLSEPMRKDLAHMRRIGMDAHERSRFILDKYGKE